MATWGEFEAASPEMAAAGRKLLYQFGVPLGYLATIRSDGGPRVHPFCPIIHEASIYGLIGPSPKQRDLARNGLYAVHTFPSPERDDEFYFTGRAHLHTSPDLAARVRATMTATGATSSANEALFEFRIERALLAQYKARGEPENWPPRYTRWRDPLVEGR